MSAKSTRKALDYAVESGAARNRSVFRPELQLCPCQTAEERYNSSEPRPKKEIPIYCFERSAVAWRLVGALVLRDRCAGGMGMAALRTVVGKDLRGTNIHQPLCACDLCLCTRLGCFCHDRPAQPARSGHRLQGVLEYFSTYTTQLFYSPDGLQAELATLQYPASAVVGGNPDRVLRPTLFQCFVQVRFRRGRVGPEPDFLAQLLLPFDLR